MVGGEHPTFHIQHSTVTLNIPHSKKGVLLGCKRAPFSMQKDSFWRAKGLVLESKRSPFLNVEC